MKHYLLLFFMPLFFQNMVAQDCYDLVWADEFSGTEINTDNWRYHSGGGFWAGQIQYYTFGGENNYAVSDGTLKLTAVEETYTANNGEIYEYTSGAVRTQDLQSWTYGKIEARIKNPTGQGIWPAYWMSPQENLYGSWPNSGEIDIFEILGHQPAKANFALHTSNDPGPEFHADHTLVGTSFADDFHIFTIEWAPQLIRWSIDETLIAEINKDDLDDNAPWPFDTDFFLRLNVGVGGNWPGNPDETTVFPQTMEVDYIRIYQKNNRINNPFFDDNTNQWQLSTTGAASGAFNVNEHEKAVLTIAETESVNWKLALRQTGFLLENGNDYRVSLTAWADTDRTVSVIVNHQSGDQYNYQSLDITTEPQHFEVDFSMTEPTDNNAFLNIGVGKETPTTYLDDISILLLPCASVITSLETTLETNSYINIYPNPIRTNEKLMFSTDEIITNLSLYTTYGSLVFQERITEESFNLPNLAAGTYFLRMKTQNGRLFTKPLIVLIR